MFEFFGSTQGTPFVLFSPLYFSLLVITFGVIFLMYMFRRTLRLSKYKKAIRYTFAAVLFFNMAIYYAGLAYAGEYDIKKHLPLEFCFVTGYILMYILVTNNKKNLYSILFYCTIVGPLPAMIFPNLSGCFDRYVFYQFIISHHLMLIASMYCIIVCQYEVKSKSAIKAFLYGNVLFVSVSILNTLWGSNYIMQRKLPDHIIELFPFVTYINYPWLWLEFCGLLMIALGIFVAKKLQQDKPPQVPDIAPALKKA